MDGFSMAPLSSHPPSTPAPRGSTTANNRKQPQTIANFLGSFSSSPIAKQPLNHRKPSLPSTVNARPASLNNRKPPQTFPLHPPQSGDCAYPVGSFARTRGLGGLERFSARRLATQPSPPSTVNARPRASTTANFIFFPST